MHDSHAYSIHACVHVRVMSGLRKLKGSEFSLLFPGFSYKEGGKFDLELFSYILVWLSFWQLFYSGTDWVYLQCISILIRSN